MNIIKKLLSKGKNLLVLIFLNLCGWCFKKKYRKNLYVFCEARGGSTWLMEKLEEFTNASLIWEPFHPYNGLFCSKQDNAWRPSIENFNGVDKLILLLDAMTSFRLKNMWSTKFMKLNSFLDSDLTIIKSVRANQLILPLLHRSYFELKPIFLTRHPVPTVLSQINAFDSDSNFNKSIFLKEWAENLSEVETNYFKEHINSKFEAYMFRWCYHNKHIDVLATNENLITIFYEDLLINRQKEIERVLSENKISTSTQSYKIDFDKASITDFNNSLKKNPEEQLAKWTTQVSNDQLNQTQSLLDFFQIKAYNINDTLPVKN